MRTIHMLWEMQTSFVNIDPATLDEMMSEVPQSRVIQDVKPQECMRRDLSNYTMD
jgi:hypothetical protein